MRSRKLGSEIPHIFLPLKYFPHIASGIWGGRNRFVTCWVKFIRISCGRAHDLAHTPDTLSGSTQIYPSQGGSPLCAQSLSGLVGDRTIFQCCPLRRKQTEILLQSVSRVSVRFSNHPRRRGWCWSISVHLLFLCLPPMLQYFLHPSAKKMFTPDG